MQHEPSNLESRGDVLEEHTGNPVHTQSITCSLYVYYLLSFKNKWGEMRETIEMITGNGR